MGSGPAFLHAGARGLVAAMAMTGTRTVTASFAEEEKSPPEAIVEERAPRVMRRLSQRKQAAITELSHWTYGAVGGCGYGLLPARLRDHPLSGPIFGLTVWLGFEVAVAPMLGVRPYRRRRVLWRLMTALDHLLYGIVVGGGRTPTWAAR